MSTNDLSLTFRVIMIFINLIFFGITLQVSSDILFDSTLTSVETAVISLSTTCIETASLFVLFLQIKNINK